MFGYPVRMGCVLLACVALAAIASPSVASASWGKKSDNGEACSQGNGHHCYSTAEWAMSGSEQVEGTLAYQYTTAANVPGWASNDFITNEEWAVFGTEWVEVGQIAGYGINCCSLHRFDAWERNKIFTMYIEQPQTVNGWENNLYQISGQSHDGHWCTYFGSTQVACPSGFPTWNKDLQVGLEVGANTKPENAGHEQTNAWWESTTHNWLKEIAYADGGLCISRYSGPPGPALGNINYGTC